MNILILAIVTLFSTSSLAFPPGYASKMGKVKNDPNALYTGIAKETMTSGSYTYVLVHGKKGGKWVATSKTEVSKGDEVEFLRGQAMKDFHSKGLNRSFKEIYFSSFFKVTKTNKHRTSEVKVGTLKKSKYSVSDVFKSSKKLKGKSVSIRAKVVKFSKDIMGKNWVHIQDGTTFKSQYDLVITTKAKVKKGDTVLVKAKVALNKDFGHGYKYPIILEEGKFTVEK